MKHELKAVSYRDRLMISLRYISAVGIIGVLLTVALSIGRASVLEKWPCVFLFLIVTSVAVEAYRARGPEHSGFIDVTSTALTHSLNGHLEVIYFSDVTKVICFGIFGNKIVILKTGNDWKEIVYSAYSIDLIHEFRLILGGRLKEGLFEWVKTWYER